MSKAKEACRNNADGVLNGSQGAETAMMHKLEEKEIAGKKSQRCSFLFSKGTCKFGDGCFYSHEGLLGTVTAGEAPNTKI